jgi:CHAT domain-containing protein
MSINERLHLGTVFSTLVVNAELKRSLPKLGELGMNNVASVLSTHGIHDVTLIPYGQLGLFPLHAVLIQRSGEQARRFGDLFTVTVAPSARAKEMAYLRAARLDRDARPLLLAVGNPQLMPKDVRSLVFAEAEADTLRRIARSYQYPADTIRCLRLRYATRTSIIEALEQAWYAHLALHAQYDFASPRRSRLIVAGNKAVPESRRSIYLSEALDGAVNLKGLRLLVLSGCETALIETGNIPDEVLGLASGFLQAGAAGVIASLWAVDDHATYLLMSRFAQLYLDPQRNWSPARALSEAQRWLREEATNRVLKSYTLSIPVTVTADPALSTVRSMRYTQEEALSQIRLHADYRAETEPDALPYADPIYWAGFFVTGC